MAKYRFAFCQICDPGHKKRIKVPEDSLDPICTRCGQGVKPNPDWWIDFYASGHRKREKIGPSKGLAETVLHKRKVEIAENKYLDIRKDQKITLEDFANEFLNVYSKPNKRSWKSDEHNLKTLRCFFKSRYLYEITALDVERFKVDRIKSISPATVNRELATLKTMFAKAILWGKIKENPTKNVKPFREPNGRLRFLEKEEVVKLLQHCQGRLRSIVILALNTGMRRGEILGLKWHDCDFRRNVICLLDTKNGEKREIPMNEQTKTALIRVRKNPKSPYIFCDKKGDRYYTVRKSFSTALEKASIKDFHLHDLRHTFASHLVMSGVDLNTIRELLGHKDIRMTLRYSHLSPGHKQRAVDILGQRMDTFWTPEAASGKIQESAVPQLAESKAVV